VIILGHGIERLQVRSADESGGTLLVVAKTRSEGLRLLQTNDFGFITSQAIKSLS
jgi:hypothetical protein